MIKEGIDNDCKNCHYCVRQYFRVGEEFCLAGCVSCMEPSMTAADKKERMENKVECNYFQHDRMQLERRVRKMDNLLMFIYHEVNELYEMVEKLYKKSKQDSRKKASGEKKETN